MHRCGRIALALAVLSMACAARADLPDGFNHPEVRWLEFQTPHFTMVYNAGLEKTARLAGEIAEQVHPKVCAALGTEPGQRTTVVLADYDDVGANNFAQRLQHVIFLYNPVMNQARVERRAWLTSLLTHEYTHVVNGWALRRAGGLLGQWTEWSGMEFQPQWFTEGLAEYVGHECSKEPVSYALYAAQQHQLLEGTKLDVAEARFDVIETATVYKQGHAMCVQLAQRFGEDVFRKIISRYGTVPQFDLAFSGATGLSTADFVGQSVKQLRAEAAKLPATDDLEKGGAALATAGLGTALGSRFAAALAAKPSPDGKWVAVYGVLHWEEPIPSLWLVSSDGTRQTRISNELDLYASWKLSWSADSRKLMYVARARNQRGSVVNALRIYDLAAKSTARVQPVGWRVGEPEFSPDGSRIVFGTYRDERALIAVMGVDGSNPRVLTEAVPGDCFSPTWSPDGRTIAFSLTDPQGTDLAVIGVDGSGFRRLTQDAAVDQYPAFSPDGRTLAFVSFRQAAAADGRGAGGRSAAVAGEAESLSGAGTNVYTIAVAGGAPTQVTAASNGGVFYPAWTADGSKLLVSLFKVRTAQILTVPSGARMAAVPPAPVPPTQAVEVAPRLTDTARSTAVALGPASGSTVPPEARPTSGPVLSVALPKGNSTRMAAAAGNAAATGAAADATPSKPYNSLGSLGHYLTRPYQHDDGLGSAYGLRSQFSDPLAKRRIRAELEYGVKSHELGYQVQVRRDLSDWQLSANLYKRVPPYRGERGVLVADRASGLELLAELPVSWASSAYIKDKVQLGFEVSRRTPFATAGGVLIPPPAPSWLVGPSLGFTRTQLLPGIGQQEMSAKVGTVDRWMGSSFGFFHGDVSYVGRYWLPDPRSTVNFAAACSYLIGSDFTRNHAEQMLGVAELRYELRLADELFSKLTWPAVYIGPVYLDAGYQVREAIKGPALGFDARDQVNLQLRNTGLLTRNFQYELTAGNRTYIGGGNPSDWYLQATVHFRDLPY